MGNGSVSAREQSDTSGSATMKHPPERIGNIQAPPTSQAKTLDVRDQDYKEYEATLDSDLPLASPKEQQDQVGDTFSPVLPVSSPSPTYGSVGSRINRPESSASHLSAHFSRRETAKWERIGGAASKEPDEDSAVHRTFSITSASSLDEPRTPSIKKVDEVSRKFLAEVMKNHFLFQTLEESEYASVFNYMVRVVTFPDQVMFEQGDKGDSCYFIHTGTFSVSIDGKVVKEMQPKQTFGELSLMYGMERTATITSSTEGLLWKMDRKHFDSCMEFLATKGNAKAIAFFGSDAHFSALAPEDHKLLASACTTQRFSDGQEILREGEVGDWLFIVISGKVLQAVSGRDADHLGSCPIIGSAGLVYGKRQVSSARAIGSVVCLALAKTSLPKLSRPVQDVLRCSAVKALLRCLQSHPDKPTVFSQMPDDQLHRLIGQFEDGIFEENELIVAPGEPGQMVLVIDGEVAIVAQVSGCERRADGAHFCIPGRHFDAHSVEQVLNDGMVYGEQELLSGLEMTRCIIAKSRTRVHRVRQSSVLQSFGEPLAEAIRFNEVKKVLQDIFLFKNLMEDQIDSTVRRLERQRFGAGDIIVKQDDPAKHFYLIQSGTICVRKDTVVLRNLGRWDYFGERGLLLQEKRSATCQALELCVCLVLDADVFFQIVGMFRKELERRMHLQDLNITMGDLKVKAVVGRGTFGIVRLVHHKRDEQKMYALKGVKKLQVVKNHQQKSIVMEREVNKQCYHPCIVQFIKTFQDREFVYFLTEFLGGGDLFYAIREIGVLTKLHSQFFSGSIVLALEYLHGRGIMYRDLKPENVLLDFKGAAKLVDFGCCKQEIRTTTLIGTPEYIAPEVITGKGYTSSCDWWSLGVMLHEFVVGPLPFGSDAEDQTALFRAILEAELRFPDYIHDEDVISCISGLLERKVDRRLGASSRGAKEIKSHRYYAEFNWDALSGGFFEPPWRPDAKALMNNWEPPDGELRAGTGDYSKQRGMEWAQGF